MKKLLNSPLVHNRLVFLLGISITIGLGIYILNPNSYHNWTIEKKQSYELNLLVKKLAENPKVFEKLEIYGEKNDNRKVKVTIYDLKNWSSFNSLCISFPNGYCDEPGTFLIHFSNYEGRLHFFSKISWVHEAGSGVLLPDYLKKIEPTILSKENLDKFALRTIIYARKSI